MRLNVVSHRIGYCTIRSSVTRRRFYARARAIRRRAALPCRIRCESTFSFYPRVAILARYIQRPCVRLIICLCVRRKSSVLLKWLEKKHKQRITITYRNYFLASNLFWNSDAITPSRRSPKFRSGFFHSKLISR